MKKWQSLRLQIVRHRYFLLFTLLFAYVQTIYGRVTMWEHVNAYTFTPEAAVSTLLKAGILFLILRHFLQRWHAGPGFRLATMLRIAGVSLLLFLAAMKMIGWVIAWLFNNIERNFNYDTFFRAMFTDLLDAFIYGSFFVAYFYFRQSSRQQQQLAQAQQALADSRFNQLKAQLNPHFLFNNLHVLDELISHDQQKASEFLLQFADIYRYVLQVADEKTVSLGRELQFARQYFHLLQAKYGSAYQLQASANALPTAVVVPLTLQVLIENAVQHNMGSSAAPVYISIDVQNGYLQVQNNRRPKQLKKTAHGRALQNLRAQYHCLTDRPMEVQSGTEFFTVHIPLLPGTC